MSRKSRAQLRAERDAALEALTECQQALADCQDVEPPPEPEPPDSGTGLVLPDGRTLLIAPPVGPLTEKNAGAAYGLQLNSQATLAGKTYEHLHLHDNTRENVLAMHWATQPGAHPVNPPLTLRDLKLENAGLGTSLNGTSAFNLRVGCSAVVSRVECHNAGWSNVWAGGRYNPLDGGGGCYGSLIEDLRCVSRSGASAAIYLEHDTINTEFRRIWVEHPTGPGFKVEWWYGADASGNRTALAANMHGSFSNKLRDFYFKTPNWAITLDYGTPLHLIENGIIQRGSKGIELPNYLIDPESAKAGNPKRYHRTERPDLDNVVRNVKWSDGSPVREGDGLTYHSRGRP